AGFVFDRERVFADGGFRGDFVFGRGPFGCGDAGIGTGARRAFCRTDGDRFFIRRQFGLRHFRIATVIVGRDRLGGRLSRTCKLLRRGVVGLALLIQERRNRDRGQNADDQYDDQELDERETTLIRSAPAQSIQHVGLLVSSTLRQPRGPSSLATTRPPI